MSTPLVVIGAGGFGRETLDVVEAINRASHPPVFNLLGVVDGNPSKQNRDRLDARGIAFLGSDVEWLKARHPAQYLVGIGHPLTRERVDRAWRSAGLAAATAVHPLAVVGSSCRIGEGSVVCAGASLSTNVTLGRHVHVNPSATIGHDSVLGDYVSLNPSATVSGDVMVGRVALIGASSVVLQGLRVGEGAIVGASACVVRDVPPGLTVKGVPAR